MFQKRRRQGEWFKIESDLEWFILAMRKFPDMHNIKSLYVEGQKIHLLGKAKRTSKTNSLNRKLVEMGIK